MFEDETGPEAVARLAAVVPADLDDADLIEVMRGWERLASWVAAGQLAAIAEFARRRPRDYADGGGGHVDRGDPRVPQISEFAVDEVATALRLTRPTAGMRVHVAVELAGRLGATAAALRAGRLDVPKARVLVDAVTGLDDALATAVQDRVLPRAGQQTTGQLRASLSRAILAADPAAAEIRHRRAVADRLVTVRPLADGMAGLWALLPADGAAALYTRLDSLARRAPANDPRPIDARRADALLSLTLADVPPTTTAATATAATTAATTGTDTDTDTGTRTDTGTGTGTGTDTGDSARLTEPPSVRALVHVTVSAATALGLADQPAHLAGHGPVPASMARRLAEHGTWRRVLTDPVTGAVTDVGRTRYTPSAALADLIRTRDITCRFPGCRQPAHRCDLDHITPWPTGPTTAANLAALCRHHHRLKHRTGWQVEVDGSAALTWTSPTGHRYTTTAADP